jgi:hypothetical protein
MNIALPKEKVTIFQFLTAFGRPPWTERNAYNSRNHPVMAGLVPAIHVVLPHRGFR